LSCSSSFAINSKPFPVVTKKQGDEGIKLQLEKYSSLIPPWKIPFEFWDTNALRVRKRWVNGIQIWFSGLYKRGVGCLVNWIKL
jgi:hypothetical protein